MRELAAGMIGTISPNSLQPAELAVYNGEPRLILISIVPKATTCALEDLLFLPVLVLDIFGWGPSIASIGCSSLPRFHDRRLIKFDFACAELHEQAPASVCMSRKNRGKRR